MPALGVAIGPAMFAILALLIVLAGVIIVKLVSYLIPSDLPIVGSSIHDFIVNIANSVLQQLKSALDSAIRPIEAVLSVPIHWVRSLYDGIVHGLAELVATAAYTVRVFIPRMLALTRRYALDLVNFAIRAAKLALAAAVATLTASIAAARRYALDLTNFAIRAARLLVAAAVTALTAAIMVTRRYALDLTNFAIRASKLALGAAVATLSASIAAVDRFAHLAYTDTLARLGHAVTAMERYARDIAKWTTAESVAAVDAGIYAGLVDVWPAITSEVDALAGGIAIDFPDILTGIKAIPRAIPRDIAVAAAATAAISVPMLRYLRECGLGNCKNLSGLGRDLQSLFALVDDAALFALITSLVTDPHGAAVEIEQVAGGLASSTIDEAKSLFRVG